MVITDGCRSNKAHRRAAKQLLIAARARPYDQDVGLAHILSRYFAARQVRAAAYLFGFAANVGNLIVDD